MGGNWPYAHNDFYIRDSTVGDFDNDGYENEIVMGGYFGFLYVLNESGDEVWKSGDLGDFVSSVVVGDLDNDSRKDDYSKIEEIADK